MIFDGFSRLGIRLQKLNGAVTKAEATLHWGIDWPTELEAIDYRLRCRDAVGVFEASDFSVLTTRYRVLAAIGQDGPRDGQYGHLLPPRILASVTEADLSELSSPMLSLRTSVTQYVSGHR